MIDSFPTAQEARVAVEENITNFNTYEIENIKSAILNAIQDARTVVIIKIENGYLMDGTEEFFKNKGYKINTETHFENDNGTLTYNTYAVVSW